MGNYIRGARFDGVLNDLRQTRFVVLLTFSHSRSGRDFLQHQTEVQSNFLATSTFIDSLDSNRRRDLLGQLNTDRVLNRDQRAHVDGIQEQKVVKKREKRMERRLDKALKAAMSPGGSKPAT